MTMKRETKSKIILVVLLAVAGVVWVRRMKVARPPGGTASVEINYPASFRNDGKGSLKITLFEREGVLTPEIRQQLDACNEILEQHADDAENLLDAFWILHSNRLHAAAAPYGQRYRLLEKEVNPGFLEALIFDLGRAGQFDEAIREQEALASIHPGFSTERASAKYLQQHRCLHACRVLRDPVVAGQAFVAMTRTDPDIPFLDHYDRATNVFSELITQLIDEGKPLPKELDEVWIFLPSTEVYRLIAILKDAGGQPSAAMLAAGDDFNEGRIAPAAAKVQRAMHALYRRGLKTEMVLKLAQQGVADGRKLGDRRELMEALWRVACFAHLMGELETEYEAMTEADRLASELKVPGLLARTKAKLGLMYEQLGDYARAFDAYDEAIELTEKHGTTALLGEGPNEYRARLLSLVGDPIKAEPLLRKLANHAERVAPGPGMRCIPYFNLGVCLSRQGRGDEAIRAFLRSAEGNDQDFKASSMIEIGRIYLSQGKPDEAEKAFETAAQCEQAVGSPERRWAWQLGKAQVRWARNEETGAREWLTKAQATIESQRASLKDYAQRRALLNNKYQVYEFGVEIELKKKDVAAAFALSERSRARTFLDALGVKAGESRPLPMATLADLQAASDSFVTVVYWSRPKELLAWIVRKDGAELVTIPIGHAALKKMMTEFYAKVIPEDDTVDWMPWMRTMWGQVWAPVEQKLKPDERVCIVPHHVLHYIPFQALHDGKQFLVEKHAIFYAPSGSGLVELRKRPGVVPTSTAIFDGALEKDPNSPFSKTPTAMLRGRYPKAQIFVREQATEETFRASGRAGLVHITAHGSYDAWIPSRSGLHLQAAGKDDGVLRAEEIGRLALNDTALVVLCSCVSSVGELADGDEVTGVTRAFQMAGARNVIGSLWPVGVTPTNRLMEVFYEQLDKRPSDPALALCEAQRRFLRESPHPYLWAAFGLNGSGRR